MGYTTSRLTEELRQVELGRLPRAGVTAATDFVSSLRGRYRSTNAYTRTRVDSGVALSEVMRWVVRAQSPTGGISAYFSLTSGWAPDYPETTGYLIPTMFDYADFSGDTRFGHRATQAGEWLLRLQRDDGSFPAGFGGSDAEPSVFNTGQILFGLVRLWKETNDASFQSATHRAADWLLAVQDVDGAWRTWTYQKRCHVYYTMVAWALAEAGSSLGEPEFVDAAAANARWAIEQQLPNGRFQRYQLPYWPEFLHFIAYTHQGLLGTWAVTREPALFEPVADAAARTLRMFEISKTLPGALVPGTWEAEGNFECLTGMAQEALVWTVVGRELSDVRYLNAVLKINESIKARLKLTGPRTTRGAVPGSFPIWGRYLSMRYPNWAAKFLADSLMAEKHALIDPWNGFLPNG